MTAQKPKRIPIKAAKDVAEKLGLRQVILVAWDGEATHVVTYGQTVEDCKQAAEGGNVIKKAIGFPEEMTDTKPARVRRRERRRKNPEAEVAVDLGEVVS